MSMEQQPDVSIIIPVYNCETYLPACLASLTAQTCKDWEAILVDDGSTDNSPAICDRAAEQDPRFRVIHKANGGVSNARNDGIDAARGRYVAFIDSDDLVSKRYIKELLGAAARFDADLVLCGYERFISEDDDWSQINRLTRFYAVAFRNVEEFLMLYTEGTTNLFGVSIWAKLFRTDLLNAHHVRFDPAISYEEDCVFVTDYLRCAKSFVALGEILYRYRQRPVSLSKGYRKDTFRFLVNGYHKRCEILKAYRMDSHLPELGTIFFSVVKNTCIKIVQSDLSRAERLQEYEVLMSYPETRDSVAVQDRTSGLNRRIGRAILAHNAKRLDRIMWLWTVADRIVDCKNRAVSAIRDRGKNGKQ